jgi:hypothetical protein
MTRVMDQVLQAIQNLVDLYRNLSFNLRATGAGTKSLTSRPWLAMSLRILDETKM